MTNIVSPSFQIRVKGSLPSLSSFPESLLNYCKGGIAFFRPGAAGDHTLDEVSIKALGLSEMSCLVGTQMNRTCNRILTWSGNVSKFTNSSLFLDTVPKDLHLDTLQHVCMCVDALYVWS